MGIKREVNLLKKLIQTFFPLGIFLFLFFQHIYFFYIESNKDIEVTFTNYPFIERISIYLIVYLVAYLMIKFIFDIIKSLKEEEENSENKSKFTGAVILATVIILISMTLINATGYIQATLSIKSFDYKLQEAIKPDNWKLFYLIVVIIFSFSFGFFLLKKLDDELKEWVKIFAKALMIGTFPIFLVLKYLLIPYTIAFIMGIFLAVGIHMSLSNKNNEEEDYI